MIQFNLLPDVKIQYIKTRYRKRIIILVATVASGVALALFMLLFLFVRVNQAKHLKDLDADIKENTSKIQAINDLDKILTVQNQLNKLPELHDKKVVSSRLLDYMTQMTPNEATISNMDVDFTANTLVIKGTAKNLATINKLVDTLKFTEFKVNKDKGEEGRAFKDVVLKEFNVAKEGDGNEMTYEINASFQPAIFAQVKDAANSPPVTLKVPNITSTRSVTEKPSGLFQAQPSTEGER